MKKKLQKIFIKTFIKNGSVGRFKNIILNFNFLMIYTIHKMLVMLKDCLNYLKNSIFECFLRGRIDFYNI